MLIRLACMGCPLPQLGMGFTHRSLPKASMDAEVESGILGDAPFPAVFGPCPVSLLGP